MDARTAIFRERTTWSLTIHWWNLLSILAIGGIYGPIIWSIWKTSIDRTPTPIQNEASELVREVDLLSARASKLAQTRIDAGLVIEKRLQRAADLRRAKMLVEPLHTPEVP